jgi:tetratricopeptide (TPR) repeat protein
MQRLYLIAIIFLIGFLLNSLYYENTPLFIISTTALLLSLALSFRQYIGHPVATWKYFRRDWQGGVEQFSITIHKFPRDAFAIFMRGNCYARLKQYDEALSDYARAFELKPKWGLCRFNSSLIAYEREDYQAAIEHADACLHIHPKWVGALAVRGSAHLALEQDDRARADFEMIMRLHPASGYAQLGLASICIKSGDFDEAIGLCSDIAHIKRVRSTALNNRAYAYAHKGDFEASLKDCVQAIAIHPEMVYVYGTRGHTYYLMGRYDEALADFKHQEMLKPNHGFALAGQAVTYFARGEAQEAREIWQRLVSLKPEYIDAQQLDSDYYPAPHMVEAASQIVASLKASEAAAS